MLSEPVRLPLEIMFAILDEAQYDDLLPRYKWLKRYSIVCSAWRNYAQRLLFRHVSLLKGSVHCKIFNKAFIACESRDPAHAAFLQESICKLSMVLDHQDIYADVAARCPNLTELHLSLYHGFFRADVLLRLAPVLRRVRSLRVRTYHYVPLFQLLVLCTGVEFLEVDCNSVLDGTLSFPVAPPAWRLRELRYNNLRRGTHAFVSWALTHAETLEVLRVACSTFELATLTELGVASTLRSLTVQRIRRAEELAPLVSLEELAVRHPGTPTPVFAALPPKVIHVALDVMDPEECAMVIKGLAEYQERCLRGGLQAITYNRRCRVKIEALPDVQMLYKFCTEHGILFRLMDPPYGYYAGEVSFLNVASLYVATNRRQRHSWSPWPQ